MPPKNPWIRIPNQSAFALGAIKATNAHGTTMTLCDLCDHHKPASAFFCMTHRVCRFCAHDFEEKIQECPSCVKRTLFGDFPEPAPPLLLPETVSLVSLEPEPRIDTTITPNPAPAPQRVPVPASQLLEGAAKRLGLKVDYNCHGCFTRYTRMPLVTDQISRCSTCSGSEDAKGSSPRTWIALQDSAPNPPPVSGALSQ